MKNFNKPRTFFIYLLCFLFSTTLYSQDRVVSGQVLDSETKTPIPGTNVLVKGASGLGTTTNLDGRYQLEVPEGSDTLIFSFVGFIKQEEPINGRSYINVSLKPDVAALEEVVVVGYGEVKKSLLTGAISSVKAEDISSVSALRVEQALQGRTAGVTVLPSSGSPGSGMKVRIRGAGSNGTAEPLYIVDGIRTGGIEYLDPNEIESVEVLKDAASAAIYGAEGANGVIIITTKKGKRESSEISYSMQYGVQSMNERMKLMSAEQYAGYLDEAGVTGNVPDPDQFKGVGGTNWLDEMFETAPMQRHSLNFSGGSEKSTYLIGGSFFNQDGVIGGDQARFSRYTARINTSHQLKQWLKVGNNLSYAHFKRNTIVEDDEFGSVINSAILMDPITPTVYTGTLPAHAQSALDKGYTLVRNGNGQYYGISNYIFGEIGNPLAMLELAKGNTIQDKVVGNVYADIEPLKGLKFTTRFGIDVAFQRYHTWNPSFYYSSERLNTSPTVSDKEERWFNWQWENFLTYERSFGEHRVTTLLGVSALEKQYQLLESSGGPMFREQDKFAYYDFILDENDRIAGVRTDNSLASYFGRVSYDYRGTYLVNFTLRRDGSSLLPENNRWGTFPSVSVGWVLSNEDFFPKTFISFLKPRASWGQNGSLSNLTAGQYLALITPEGVRYPFGSGGFYIGAEPDFLANLNLLWETSEQLDIGFDMGLFNESLSLSFDYYNKITRNLLTPGTPPNFAGNDASFVNGGDVRNRGVEIELNYRNKIGELGFEIGGNLTSINNKVTYLNPHVSRIKGSDVGVGWTATFFEEGYPIWYYRGYETNGIFQNQTQINEYLAATGLEGYAPQPGDPIVVDVNKDGRISPEDQTYIGDPHPDFVYGGRIGLNYKGFDFLAFIQGSSGNDILMGFNRPDRATANKPAFFYEDRWTGEGSTNEWFRAETASPYVYNSDLMVFDGSYLRVRQLQLGYNLPQSILDVPGFRKARLYISLDDFFTFTSYPGLDPEAGSNDNNSLGIDRGVYPIPRKFITGLSINF